MTRIRRAILILSLVFAIVCFILLLNVTAPNPTGRRYSSEMPLTTGQGNSQSIGKSAERILSQDLSLPNNNDPDQLQCFCNSASNKPRNICNTCAVVSQTISNYRLPDFIGSNFIADSKNVKQLMWPEINDYIASALLMKKSLWIYTRVDSEIKPEYIQLAESTGGGVVRYFTVPGYVDSVDAAARDGLMLSLAFIGLMLVWERMAYMKRRPRVVVVPDPQPNPPLMPRKPGDALNRAARKADHAADFASRSRERAQGDFDEQDSRDDFI